LPNKLLKKYFLVEIIASKALMIIEVKSIASCATLELDSGGSISGELFNTKLRTHSVRGL
jgi:hypothetical protein